jgi:hypothetical protein
LSGCSAKTPAEKFQQQADASAKLVDLKKVSTWERGTFVEKGGWGDDAWKLRTEYGRGARLCGASRQTQSLISRNAGCGGPLLV